MGITVAGGTAADRRVIQYIDDRTQVRSALQYWSLDAQGGETHLLTVDLLATHSTAPVIVGALWSGAIRISASMDEGAIRVTATLRVSVTELFGSLSEPAPTEETETDKEE